MLKKGDLLIRTPVLGNLSLDKGYRSPDIGPNGCLVFEVHGRFWRGGGL